MSKFLTVKMRSAIILATILGVAVTASQSVDFSDDELKAANHLPDSIREKFWSAYSYLLNGAVKVINGVPISTESAINDSYYTIESLYDGRVNLEDYAINGVKEVALNTKSFLVGKQSAVKSILEATIPDVGSVVLNGTIEHFDAWARLLCFWKSLLYQFRMSIYDITATLDGLSCDNIDGPPAVKVVSSETGTFVTVEYLNYYGCYVTNNLGAPADLFSKISSSLPSLECQHYYN